MIDSADLEGEELALWRDVDALRHRNTKFIEDIESVYGPKSVDLTHARIDHLWDQLVQIGVITVKQELEALKAFELHIRGQLKDVRAQAANTVRQQQSMQKQAQASDNGQPLTLPAGARGEGRLLHLPDGRAVNIGQARPEGETAD